MPAPAGTESIIIFRRHAIYFNNPGIRIAVRGKLRESNGSSEGAPDLVAYIGHNGLMDFALPADLETINAKHKDSIVLCCRSMRSFENELGKRPVNPVLMTDQLMYPGAFLLEAALEGWLKGETTAQLRDRAAAAYQKNQKISFKAARGMFTDLSEQRSRESSAPSGNRLRSVPVRQKKDFPRSLRHGTIPAMDRLANLQRLEDSSETWDVIVIGGGASGLSVAFDSATRGFRTLLLEQSDYAKGTSSRSTKLIHGGVRYLKQGNISLVRESLHERGRLLRNAPDLVRPMPFVVPGYHWWEPYYYTLGLKAYDFLAGQLGIDRSRFLSRKKALEWAPGISAEGLNGGTLYYDAQFDDARLALAFARSAADAGACLLNYMRVTGLEKSSSGRITGVRAIDALNFNGGKEHTLSAQVVINCTGVFTDSVRRMDDAGVGEVIEPSQGIHIVLDRDFLPGDAAIMIPKTDDGRVLFAIPWLGRVILGTTDTADVLIELDPTPRQDEIDYLIEHAGRYLAKAPTHADIRATFAGLRPLVRPPKKSGATSEISRDHSLFVSNSGLVTLTGGKWTTCRKMAEDCIDKAITLAGLPAKSCVTQERKLNQSHEARTLPAEDQQPLHPRLPYTRADVIAAVRYEMAQTVDDVLSRRTRSSFLDEKATAEIAPEVARLMARESGNDQSWIDAQLSS